MTRPTARDIRGPLPAQLIAVLLVAAVLIELFVLLRHAETWRQSQLGTVQWHALAALLLSPLAAAAAAIETAAMSGSLLGTLATVQRRQAACVQASA